jgi:hypothetical protein
VSEIRHNPPKVVVCAPADDCLTSAADGTNILSVRWSCCTDVRKLIAQSRRLDRVVASTDAEMAC